MIKIELNDKVIEIPEDLSIEKFAKITKNQLKYSKTDELLALYLDIDINELKDMPKDKMDFVETYITNIFDSNMKNQLYDTFTFNNVEYGLENDWANLRWGQWTDMEVFSQKDSIDENIHNIMALLYRPIKTKNKKGYVLVDYKSADVLPRGNDFKQLPAKYWLGAANFFLRTSLYYTTNINNSMNTWMKIRKITSPVMKVLPKWLHPKLLRGSTTNLPTSLQTKILPNSKP